MSRYIETAKLRLAISDHMDQLHATIDELEEEVERKRDALDRILGLVMTSNRDFGLQEGTPIHHRFECLEAIAMTGLKEEDES